MKVRDYKNDLGVPDWRNASAYPGEAATAKQWQWEFLRRRPDYRQAWREQYDKSQSYYDELGSVALSDTRERLRSFGSPHLSDVRERFHLELMIAPSWQYEPLPGMFISTFGMGYSYHPDGTAMQLKGDHQMAIVFDLSLSLEAQLRKAKSFLSARQQQEYPSIKQPRNHVALWPKYLRVLDARDASETFQNIFVEIELLGLAVAEFDERSDRQNCAASGKQLWEQASDLMFKLTS